MWLSLTVGALALPYATLWVSRSARVRALSEHLDWTGWPTRLVALAVVLGTLLFGLAGGPFASFPVRPVWAVTTLLLFGSVHVDLFVAAGEMRRYPDERALHFDLAAPGTWPATARRIYATWSYLMATRHRWLAPAFLGCAALWWVAPVLGVPSSVAAALASDCLVLGTSCTHGSFVDHREPRARLAHFD
ncbi:hypothetical protein [Halomarina ordinaria]|uniref:Uncharacterized protein n=1 Tax=Halomarina ordinaria TaxID=3033939 RepID=A0ABD5UCX7_9EURY|nr:hypothetical protein [Halomarina sp. PSRA2]